MSKNVDNDVSKDPPIRWSGSHNRAALLKRHNNSLFLRSNKNKDKAKAALASCNS